MSTFLLSVTSWHARNQLTFFIVTECFWIPACFIFSYKFLNEKVYRLKHRLGLHLVISLDCFNYSLIKKNKLKEISDLKSYWFCDKVWTPMLGCVINNFLFCFQFFQRKKYNVDSIQLYIKTLFAMSCSQLPIRKHSFLRPLESRIYWRNFSSIKAFFQQHNYNFLCYSFLMWPCNVIQSNIFTIDEHRALFRRSYIIYEWKYHTYYYVSSVSWCFKKTLLL